VPEQFRTIIHPHKRFSPPGRKGVAHRYAYFSFLCGFSFRVRVNNQTNAVCIWDKPRGTQTTRTSSLPLPRGYPLDDFGPVAFAGLDDCVGVIGDADAQGVKGQDRGG